MKNSKKSNHYFLFIVILALWLASGLGCSDSSTQSEPTESTKCENLISFSSPDVTIASATMVTATDTVPSHCDVRGEISKTIGFAVKLPVSTAWNSNFHMVGNGGFAGYISDGAMDTVLTTNYATASTDTGHASTYPFPSGMGLDTAWAYDNLPAEIDYCYRAVHLTALTAKEIINAYYGSRPVYSYWSGCSTGGRQGMINAQRFPTLFDGILAGAPTINQAHVFMQFNWNGQALASAPIDYEKLQIIRDAVYEKCDGIDGLVDGLIDDPRQCPFDPAQDLPICSGDVDGPDCFTSAQISTLEKIYGGVKNSEGELLCPGTPIGGEIVSGGWFPWLVDPDNTSMQLGMQEAYMKYMAFEVDPGPDYDWTTFNFDTDPPKLEFFSALQDSLDPDLSAFKANGGKIVSYHGWTDVAVSPFMLADYYEEVLALMGDKETKDFYTLYMVPGMYHCSGGVGCESADFFTQLVNWVEKGISPEEIIGSHIEGGDVLRTRPLCPYPEVARYNGSGSIDEAANFDCVIPATVSIESETLN